MREAGLINLNPELEQRVLEGKLFRILTTQGFVSGGKRQIGAVSPGSYWDS